MPAGAARTTAPASPTASTLRRSTAAAVLGTPADRAYDVVLVDPPYEVPDSEVAGWLAAAAAHGWLAEDVMVVVERSARGGPFPWPEPLHGVRERHYGDTALHVALR